MLPIRRKEYSFCLYSFVVFLLTFMIAYGEGGNTDNSSIIKSEVLHELSGTFEPDSLSRFEFTSPHMGTLFRIVLYAQNDSIASLASGAAFDRVEELNSIMSDYLPDSEIRTLSNNSGSKTPVHVSDPLFHVLEFANEISEKSAGAFDVTVGPFVQLWRELRRTPSSGIPDQNTLMESAERVGYHLLKLDADRKTVTLPVSGMQLDLGGIAKGYATDEALQVLRQYGITSALVDGGGDIRFGDAPPEREGWTVAIPSTRHDGLSSFVELTLSNKAVATSGDLFQYVEIDGTRYSHIIDPRTGLGITQQRTVTVIARDGITADSYASAFTVLGPSEGLGLAEVTSAELEVRFEQLTGDSVEEWESTGFKAFRRTTE